MHNTIEDESTDDIMHSEPGRTSNVNGQVVETTLDADKVEELEDSEEVEKIGFQEEIGTFVKSVVPYHALVISQGWPSWSFALDGLGFESMHTLASFGSVSSREEFLSTSLGETLINQTHLNKWLASHCDNGIIFVQGERAFLESVYHKQAIDFKNIKLVYACTDEDYFTADGMRLSHQDFGGVTNGEWTVYTEGVTLSKLKVSKVRRNLKHLLSTTEGASSTSQLEKCVGEPLNLFSTVPWGITDTCSVRVPSVFQKGDLVTRCLTDKELMNIYDIELITQSELSNLFRLKNRLPSNSFIKQIPIKVLRAVRSAVLLELAVNDDDLSSIDSGDSNITLQRNNESRSLVEPLLDDQSYDSIDDRSIAGEVEINSSEDIAAKRDDAEAEPEEWDRWSVNNFTPNPGDEPLVCTGIYDTHAHKRLFNAFRDLLARRYRRNVLQSFLKYMRTTHFSGKTFKMKLMDSNRVINIPLWVKHIRSSSKGSGKLWNLHRDCEVGIDAIRRASWSSWWNWDSGSTLYFWRWPKNVRVAVRDGTKLFVNWDKLPKYTKRQKWPNDENDREKLEAKIRKVRTRGYIQPGFVKSLTGFFAVPKAGSDIRVVYDATQCGLNDALWAPNFFLPTVDAILRNASSSTWFGDIDLGEMFLNYALDLDLRPYAGIDVTELDKTLVGSKVQRIFERWTRTLMGFKPSPYVCTQMFSWGEELIVGDRTELDNPFHWDKVVLNLPGTNEYDPTMPVVY